MSNQQTALRLALEALEEIANETYDSWTNGAKAQRIAQGLIPAIKEALARPEQEPANGVQYTQGIPFFIPPVQRFWVGLTQEEVEDSYNSDYKAQTRAIEAKLKENNT